MYVTLSFDPSPLSGTACDEVPSRSGLTTPRLRRHPAQSHLFLEGDEADNLYEIRSGMVRLARVMEDGRRQVIAFGLPGDIVGFPNGTRHHTDCEVIADAEVLVHRRSALQDGRTDPETHQRLLCAALREISAMQDHFMMLARKTAMEKVASFLVVLSQRAGRTVDGACAFALPMSRADIADFLGLTVETISRMISLLRKEGVIAMPNPHQVEVHDMAALSRAAEAA